VSTISFRIVNGLPTTPITVNGVPITNPTDVRNLIAAETQSIEVANSFRGKPITQESQNATGEARAKVRSVAQVALNNARAGQTPEQNLAAQPQLAQTQTPPRPPVIQNADVGTNAPTRNTANAARDDNTGSSAAGRAVRDSNADRIIPQDNVLSQYSSYTYNISIYILSPNDYNEIVRTKKFKIPGRQLLISSGGAPAASTQGTGSPGGNTGVTGSSNQAQAEATAGRNQFFPLDFYINDVKLTTLQPGKGTRSPHSNTTLTFKITEPNGLTFIDDLYAACRAYVGPNQNYGAQNYCMVIKFYGYDDTGKMVQAQGINTGSGGTAVVEKWIPFQFTGIKFRVANRLTEYDCSAACTPNNIATGQARGVIPYNAEINAPTLKEILGGNATYSTAPTPAAPVPTASPGGAAAKAPPKSNTAPKPTIVSGLVQALNQYQERLAGIGEDSTGPSIFDVADVYDIQFTDSKLENASVLPPVDSDQRQTPTVQPTNANQVVNGAVQTGAANSKNTSATAGTSIVQFLDQTLRGSSYIYDQQLKVATADGQEIIRNIDKDQGVDWYRIGVKAEPIKYDPKRRDYAYKITYIVSPYRVNEIKGPYFPKTKFRGTHKKYLYWFTGLNTEILSYEQDFNYSYYVVVNSGQNPVINLLDFREEPKYVFQTNSNESSQGQPGKINEAGANAADQLNSPGDLARARMTILGDPAWIHQGEFWFGATEGTGFTQPFFPDGSINTEIQEPLFEIGFNKPADYDLQSGRMEVGSTDLGANRYTTNNGENGAATQSYIYRAVSVTSTFSGGKFTQDIEGVLITFPRSAIKANVDTDDQYVTTEQETERILRNLDAANSARAATNALAGGLVEEQASPAANSVPAQPASPTSRNNEQSTAAPAPAAPATSPTSSGQPVAPAPSNTQTTTTESTLNGEVFQRNDPAGFGAYTGFIRQRSRELTTQFEKELIAQAQQNTPGAVNSGRILTVAQARANSQALIEARTKFATQIQAAGAGSTGTTNTVPRPAATVPRESQITNRDY
jgi:hypothetical protein